MASFRCTGCASFVYVLSTLCVFSERSPVSLSPTKAVCRVTETEPTYGLTYEMEVKSCFQCNLFLLKDKSSILRGELQNKKDERNRDVCGCWGKAAGQDDSWYQFFEFGKMKREKCDWEKCWEMYGHLLTEMKNAGVSPGPQRLGNDFHNQNHWKAGKENCRTVPKSEASGSFDGPTLQEILAAAAVGKKIIAKKHVDPIPTRDQIPKPEPTTLDDFVVKLGDIYVEQKMKEDFKGLEDELDEDELEEEQDTLHDTVIVNDDAEEQVPPASCSDCPDGYVAEIAFAFKEECDKLCQAIGSLNRPESPIHCDNCREKGYTSDPASEFKEICKKLCQEETSDSLRDGGVVDNRHNEQVPPASCEECPDGYENDDGFDFKTLCHELCSVPGSLGKPEPPRDCEDCREKGYTTDPASEFKVVCEKLCQEEERHASIDNRILNERPLEQVPPTSCEECPDGYENDDGFDFKALCHELCSAPGSLSKPEPPRDCEDCRKEGYTTNPASEFKAVCEKLCQEEQHTSVANRIVDERPHEQVPPTSCEECPDGYENDDGFDFKSLCRELCSAPGSFSKPEPPRDCEDCREKGYTTDPASEFKAVCEKLCQEEEQHASVANRIVDERPNGQVPPASCEECPKGYEKDAGFEFQASCLELCGLSKPEPPSDCRDCHAKGYDGGQEFEFKVECEKMCEDSVENHFDTIIDKAIDTSPKYKCKDKLPKDVCNCIQTRAPPGWTKSEDKDDSTTRAIATCICNTANDDQGHVQETSACVRTTMKVFRIAGPWACVAKKDFETEVSTCVAKHPGERLY